MSVQLSYYRTHYSELQLFHYSRILRLTIFGNFLYDLHVCVATPMQYIMTFLY